MHKKALKDWERKEQLLTAKIERKKKRSSNLGNDMYQLIGFFCVFQGVVLTVVAHSSLLRCNIPFILRARLCRYASWSSAEVGSHLEFGCNYPHRRGISQGTYDTMLLCVLQLASLTSVPRP